MLEKTMCMEEAQPSTVQSTPTLQLSAIKKTQTIQKHLINNLIKINDTISCSYVDIHTTHIALRRVLRTI
jgi:hypothetical protein